MQTLRKLLLITDTWHETNGVTTTLRHTVEVGTRRGCEIEIMHPGLFPCFPNPIYRQYWHALPAPARVRALLRQIRPQAVHLVTEGPLGLVGRREVMKQGWRFTTSFHTRWDEHCKHLLHLPPSLPWRWLRWFHEPSARVLVPTLSIMRLLRDQGFCQDLTLWQRGINGDLFYPRSRQHQTVKRPVLLYVGRVSREKNIPAFLDVEVEGTKYIVGEGPLLAQLQRTYHREVDAGRVIFFGEQKGVDLAALYAEADVFVFPSLTDTFGNVILEALASGVPVAAYPVPGPVDILCHRDLGALHADLGVAIRQALARGRSDACRAYAQRYTWQAATEQFLQAVVPVGSMASKQPIAPARASLCQQLNHI